MTGSKLIDLGEQEILNSIVFPSIARSVAGSAGLGDDCAVIEVPGAPEGTVLVATIDPCPLPLVFELFDSDYWHFGWMTAVINLSDLAAMGADPAGILVSTVMPNEMPVHDYSRFWDGLIEASDKWSCKVLGGNVKDGSQFSAEGAAFGWCAKGSVLRRTGSAEGDLVYVVGDMGHFWSSILYKLRAGDLDLTEEENEQVRLALSRPVPRVQEGKALAASGLVTACMDASDGVLGALMELGRVNQLDVDLIELEPDSLARKVSSRLDVPPLKLMLSWGDWQLVVAVRKENQSVFESLARTFSTPVRLVGGMMPGCGQVRSKTSGSVQQLADQSSERFSGKSYFTHGLSAYIDWFIETPLYVKQ